MAKRKPADDDLFSASPPAVKKEPVPEPPTPEPQRRKGKRVWLTNGFELPSGIDRTGLELGEPKPFRKFTVEALKKVGAVGIYRIA